MDTKLPNWQLLNKPEDGCWPPRRMRDYTPQPAVAIRAEIPISIIWLSCALPSVLLHPPHLSWFYRGLSSLRRSCGLRLGWPNFAELSLPVVSLIINSPILDHLREIMWFKHVENFARGNDHPNCDDVYPLLEKHPAVKLWGRVNFSCLHGFLPNNSITSSIFLGRNSNDVAPMISHVHRPPLSIGKEGPNPWWWRRDFIIQHAPLEQISHPIDILAHAQIFISAHLIL